MQFYLPNCTYVQYISGFELKYKYICRRVAEDGRFRARWLAVDLSKRGRRGASSFFFPFSKVYSYPILQSGLLAGVGAQLLTTFQGLGDPPAEPVPAGAKEFLLATCYASIFLNIAATICSFVLIDHLGEIGFEAAAIRDPEDDRQMGKIRTSQDKLLMKFGASNQWKAMLYHCR